MKASKTTKLSCKAAQTLVGTTIGGYKVDDVGLIKGRWAFYFENDCGDYGWDWV